MKKMIACFLCMMLIINAGAVVATPQIYKANSGYTTIGKGINCIILKNTAGQLIRVNLDGTQKILGKYDDCEVQGNYITVFKRYEGCGIMNLDGRLIVPCQYDHVSDLDGDIAIVNKYSSYDDTVNSFVFDLKTGRFKKFDTNGYDLRILYGTRYLLHTNDEDYSYDIWDLNGKNVLKDRGLLISDFCGEYIEITDIETGKVGIMDKNFKVILSPKYDCIYWNWVNGYNFSPWEYEYNFNNRENDSDEITIMADDELFYLVNGTIVKEEDRLSSYGIKLDRNERGILTVKNKAGNIIAPAGRFDEINVMGNMLVAERNYDKYLIKKNGEYASKTKYYDFVKEKNFIIAIYNEDINVDDPRCDIFTKNGDLVVPHVQYNNVEVINNYCIKIFKNEKLFSIINEKGKTIASYSNASISNYVGREGYFCVQTGKEQLLFDDKGKCILRTSNFKYFDFIERSDGGYELIGINSSGIYKVKI